MADKPKRKNWITAATSNSHGQFKAKAKAAGESTAAFGAARKSKLYSHPRSNKD